MSSNDVFGDSGALSKDSSNFENRPNQQQYAKLVVEFYLKITK